MTFAEFRQSLKNDDPPAGISNALIALWYDGKDDWDRSHDIAQEIHTEEGSRIHAYLHRKEGDLSNASYWYRRAGASMPRITLSEEWELIAKDLLK